MRRTNHTTNKTANRKSAVHHKQHLTHDNGSHPQATPRLTTEDNEGGHGQHEPKATRAQAQTKRRCRAARRRDGDLAPKKPERRTPHPTEEEHRRGHANTNRAANIGNANTTHPAPRHAYMARKTSGPKKRRATSGVKNKHPHKNKDHTEDDPRSTNWTTNKTANSDNATCQKPCPTHHSHPHRLATP